MTAPTTDPTDTPAPSDNDDALFAALTGADRSDAERFAETHLAPTDAGETPPPDEETAETPDELPDDADAPEEAEDPAPEAAADAPDTTAPDPFAALVAEAQPLTYKVNGQDRTLDFIREIPNKGAVIPADKVQEVRNLIARGESNAEANKELYGFRQEVERLGGVAKFKEQAERTAMTDAAATYILDTFLRDPTQFVTVNAQGQVVPNKYLLDLAIKESTIKAKEAQWEYRTQQEQAQSQWREEASVEQVRETALPDAVQRGVQHYGLSQEDAQAALAHFGPFRDALMFKATPEQAAQWGVKPGTLMVDLPKMEPWFRDRAEMRKAQQASAERKAQAQKENAARAAQTAPKPKPQPPRNPQNGQFAKEQPKKKMSLAEMKRRAMAGKPIPGDDDYTDD